MILMALIGIAIFIAGIIIGIFIGYASHDSDLFEQVFAQALIIADQNKTISGLMKAQSGLFDNKRAHCIRCGRFLPDNPFMFDNIPLCERCYAKACAFKKSSNVPKK